MITIDWIGIIALMLFGWLGFNAVFFIVGRQLQERRRRQWRTESDKLAARRSRAHMARRNDDA